MKRIFDLILVCLVLSFALVPMFLIALRSEKGVHVLPVGVTGWAQVNGRDELPIADKVKLDVEYLQRHSIRFDCYVLWLTLIKVIRREGVSH